MFLTRFYGRLSIKTKSQFPIAKTTNLRYNIAKE